MISSQMPAKMVLESIARAKTANRRNRKATLESYLDFYMGGDNPLAHLYRHRREDENGFNERQQRFCNFGIVSRMAHALISSLYAKPIERTFTGDEEATLRYAAILDAARYPANQRLTGQSQVVLGGCYVAVGWSEALGRETIHPTSPLSVWPEQHPDDPHELVSIIEERAHPFDDLNRINWVWTPEEFCALDLNGNYVVLRDAKGTTYSGWQANRYGVIPYAYCRGLPLIGEFEGLSAIRDCVQIQKLINNRSSMLDRICLYESHAQPWLADRAKPSNIILSETKALGLTENGKFGYSSPGAPISEVQATVDRLVDYLLMIGGVPKSVVVGGSANSGYQLEIEYRAMQDVVNDLAVGLEDLEQRLRLLVSAVHLHHTGEVIAPDNATFQVQIDRNVLPRDEDREFLRERQLWMDGLIPTDDFMRRWVPADLDDPIRLDQYKATLIADQAFRKQIKPAPAMSDLLGGAI